VRPNFTKNASALVVTKSEKGNHVHKKVVPRSNEHNYVMTPLLRGAPFLGFELDPALARAGPGRSHFVNDEKIIFSTYEKCVDLTDRQTDRQTMLVYFTWPTKRPGGHQCQLTFDRM